MITACEEITASRTPYGRSIGTHMRFDWPFRHKQRITWIDKAQQWRGYYAYYLYEARAQGVAPVAVLDQQWFDGRTNAMSVLPYLNENSEVLEIACGIGRVGRFVAPHCRQLHCADILDEALAQARITLGQFKNVLFETINGYDLSRYQADYFDCVYSFTTFFHFDFELVVGYFGEIHRVLKSGGVAMIEFMQCKDADDIENLVEKIAHQGGLRIYHTELDKWRYVSAEMLRVLCAHYGFQILDENIGKFTFRKP